jgi:hypothetical protein
MTKQGDSGWRCEKCGEHMFLHGLRRGVPICPEKQEPAEYAEIVEK